MRCPPLLSVILLAFVSQAAAAPAPDRIVLPADVVPSHYDLTITPDAAKRTFEGHVAIDLAVSKPTRTITFNSADLTYRSAALSDADPHPALTFDPEQQTATLTFPTPVPAGHHVLTINYDGKINSSPAGFFALDYDAEGGKKRALFTQFENSDARRFLPCWDEPARKATYTLTVIVPAGQMAVSNMPVAATASAHESAGNATGGLQKIRFAETPKMSSYLLFFALGDFERISNKVDGVDVGVIVKRGDIEKARYALDAASHILPYYEDYFGVKYPLPKLDLIAGPGQSQFFGAMENWGAIFAFERDLLIDPKISTQLDRRSVYVVVAHEMAHQWFGDLVTMDWWDGIWLNEGFASWMENKSTDHFHPEWKMWLESLDAKEGAMQEDARAGTHPIITPIRDVLQANEAFDTITYSKGQAVIRMLENYVGEDPFRDGVRAYIQAHAYGNTTSDDLWRELDKTSPVPVAQIAHDFTLQAGVPLIRVTSEGNTIRLSQDRFYSNGRTSPTVWHVPVVAALGASPDWRGIVSRDKPVTVKADATAIVNEEQAGYFRTLYDATLFAKIISAFPTSSAADQLGVLNDSLAFGYSGYAPPSDFLALANTATVDSDPTVLGSVARAIEDIDVLYEGLPGGDAFAAYGRNLLDPIFAKTGWTGAAEETQNTALLREELLSALSELDDPAVVEGAKARFQTYLKDPSSLSAELRHSVLSIVAQHADAQTWDRLHALALSAKSALEKDQLYRLLGAPKDKTLASRALALAVTDEIPATTRPTIMRAVSWRFPDLAVDFAAAHWDAVAADLEPDSRAEYVPDLASNALDTDMLAKLRAFAAAHIPANARGDERKAESAIEFHAKVRAQCLPQIDRWLAQRGK